MRCFAPWIVPVALAGCYPRTAEPDPVAGKGDVPGQIGVDCQPTHLSHHLPWYGDNADRLNALLDTFGCASESYHATAAPVAVFDWDNTVIKNDVGDAVMFFMLEHDKILQPAAWARTSRFLTESAVVALANACGSETPAGEPLRTSVNTACTDEILSIYADGETTAGTTAFAGHDHRMMEPAYAWAAQLQAGYTPQELRAIADQAIGQNLAAPIGATQKVGSREVTGYIRVYEQIQDLISALGRNGFNVWVVSASSQSNVEAFAERIGLSPARVIGVRTVLMNGRASHDLEGCGDVADGENRLITYIDGKRCWINQVIFAQEGTQARHVLPRAKRQVFAAGDSDTDVTFLRDATVLRLVINRNKEELMCYAYAGAESGWLINPMFIGPKGKRAAPYPCSSTACKDSLGTPGPCPNDDDDRGGILADQEDTVF